MFYCYFQELGKYRTAGFIRAVISFVSFFFILSLNAAELEQRASITISAPVQLNFATAERWKSFRNSLVAYQVPATVAVKTAEQQGSMQWEQIKVGRELDFSIASYTIKKDDNASILLNKNNLRADPNSLALLLELNPNLDLNYLYPNKIIKLPFVKWSNPGRQTVDGQFAILPFHKERQQINRNADYFNKIYNSTHKPVAAALTSELNQYITNLNEFRKDPYVPGVIRKEVATSSNAIRQMMANNIVTSSIKLALEHLNKQLDSMLKGKSTAAIIKVSIVFQDNSLAPNYVVNYAPLGLKDTPYYHQTLNPGNPVLKIFSVADWVFWASKNDIKVSNQKKVFSHGLTSGQVHDIVLQVEGDDE